MSVWMAKFMKMEVVGFIFPKEEAQLLYAMTVIVILTEHVIREFPAAVVNRFGYPYH